ncbi:MAG: sigma-54-dependent Fis family transcriptional regulator [Dehalococcoidia bacterium]|nr:sigma-54-dependent Fis family transcriptional regulator [Myxococcales bacterium]MCB9492214.1 sigma-54-dependent Fis family transcriptional regulator [Dehalococcoidia bacterium]
MTLPRVLVCDDKENYTKLFQRILPDDRFEVVTAGDGARALGLLAASEFDVIVTDIRMPGADGLTVLRQAHARDPDIEVILMTAYATVPAAVSAMREGAFDYLAKPFEPDEALLVVERAVERRRLRQQARDLRLALEGIHQIDKLVAKSPAMAPALALIQRAAAGDATVLLAGESGTGKEVAARAIHASGTRHDGRFVAVNCGAIPEALIESELFGHVKGSFTGAATDHRGLFEEAEAGTIFLDEISELPLAMQVKLNRVLQERAVRRVGASHEHPVDVRVIAATNRDLRAQVAAGHFREDLFYRLNVLPIVLPPLRERREDIPVLAAVFLERHGGGRPGRPQGFTAESLSALVRHDWPGNVRELENAVERALAVSDGRRIELEALPDEVAQTLRPRLTRSTEIHLTYREVVDLARDRASREYLIALMRELGGNVTEGARRAGMERESMHRLLKRYGVRSEEFKQRT